VVAPLLPDQSVITESLHATVRSALCLKANSRTHHRALCQASIVQGVKLSLKCPKEQRLPQFTAFTEVVFQL